MDNLMAYWFLLIPGACIAGLLVWFKKQNITVSWQIMVLYAVVSIALVFGTFGIYESYKTTATEVWNGEIVNKSRHHDSYVRSYSCNCRTTKSGDSTSISCDTCYEDHYTVTWACGTTIGPVTIDYADWTSRAVYDLPNPNRWTQIQPGEPVSIPHKYTNWVQAAPQSLFQTHFGSDAAFKDMIPAYPDKLYDYYHVNRFLPVGVAVPDALEWNAGIQEMLKRRGPIKEVNAIVVVVNSADEHYQYALQDAWIGAAKNDVVLVLGSTHYPKIDWVAVLSWTDQNLFKIELHDAVEKLGTIDREKILSILGNQIDKNFQRRHMREFAYLKSEISPPTWLLVLLAIFLVGAAYGAARIQQAG